MISDKEMRKRIADMSPQELLKASETFEALYDLVHQHDDNSIAKTNPDYYNPDYQSPWISITSGRLPEKFQECIVLDKRRHVHNWIHYDALLPLFAQFTHWMPLPELPEEVK